MLQMQMPRVAEKPFTSVDCGYQLNHQDMVSDSTDILQAQPNGQLLLCQQYVATTEAELRVSGMTHFAMSRLTSCRLGSCFVRVL